MSGDQRGQPIDVDLGNGVSVIAGFDALTGLIDYKQSGTGGSTTNIQDLVYDRDDNGNLTERRDDRQSLTETFFYDSMNRLDYSELGGTQNLDLAYEDNGNILNKDDVSGSNYGYHASKVHAVTSAGTNSFEYDANGNAKKRNGHTITWTSYNKPSDINGSGGQDSQFWYAPDRSRWKQVATYISGTETTIYVGGLLEKRTVGSVTEYQHLIPAPDGTRIHRVLRSNSTTDTFYLATDHLGSADAILNATGGVEVYTSFDSFGQRRDPTDWDGPPSSSDLSKIADTTRRGYTGHEHLDNLGLIHMNGRVQDPLVGRFISADPYVPAPYYSQSLNRYSYVFNAPLTYTDPSGFDPDWRERGCIASDYCRRVYNDLRRRMHEPPWNLPPYPAPPGPTGDTDDQPDTPGPEIGPPVEDSRPCVQPPVTATDGTFTAGIGALGLGIGRVENLASLLETQRLSRSLEAVQDLMRAAQSGDQLASELARQRHLDESELLRNSRGVRIGARVVGKGLLFVDFANTVDDVIDRRAGYSKFAVVGGAAAIVAISAPAAAALGATVLVLDVGGVVDPFTLWLDKAVVDTIRGD